MSALTRDGTVVLWGYQTDTPARLRNVVAIATGFYQTLALVGDGPPILKAAFSAPVMSGNTFSVSLPTRSGRVYGLEYKTSLDEQVWAALPLQAGDESMKVLADPTASVSQRFYREREW